MISINVLIVFTLGSTVVAGKELWEHVNSCPQNQTEWIDRSSKFYCIKSNEKYHCVLDSTWKLVEVCIAPLTVKESKKGCPSIYIFESAPYWVFPFSPCPLQNKDCPQEDHLGYSTEQLFKYPACLQNASYRTTSGVDIQTVSMITIEAKRKQQDEFYRTDVNYLPFVLITIIVLNIALFILMILTARYLLLRIERVTKQEMPKAESLHSVSSIVPFMGTTLEKQAMPSTSFKEEYGFNSSDKSGQKNRFDTTSKENLFVEESNGMSHRGLCNQGHTLESISKGNKIFQNNRRGKYELNSPALDIQACPLESNGKGKKMSENHCNHRKNELKSPVLDVQANPAKPTGKGIKMSESHRNYCRNELNSQVLDVQSHSLESIGRANRMTKITQMPQNHRKGQNELTSPTFDEQAHPLEFTRL